HCRSAQNDLGAQKIKPKASFGWPFGDRVFGNTLFWCDVSLNGKSRSFNAYDQKKNYDY
ncbi:hypothetical protein SELMODRAFT_59760, partial [Selaginella moellendorffii]